MKLFKYLMVLACLLLASCASTEPEKELVSIENDPRIGERVNRACFISNMDGWSNVDNDDNALIMTMRRNEQYKLNLLGACDADWAMYRIAIIGKSGSGCIERGDKIKTDANTMRGMSCTIMSINKWHPEKLEKTTEKTAEVDSEKLTKG